ncbi:Ppx/GppA family phosphatase [Fructobacillus durionis]|uniref:Exopolyphosphatase / guanosine-5'-triphosphate,3'-diphosphate pyrophosphatase n=1 Tax=Fructobacillus durionis TaxID=283737 RepID=A0A1I1EZH0_9LACO|nr:Ppx/GppA family phosphatase [Fructobacillus durionis]SFB92599.1 exopolyphosphatase / guanosine-5'-triphosphate,3'-diphosphate pyrophosphatase [Fructobacillus durionis]
MENFAIIDLGSNSIRLEVDQINDDASYQPILEAKEVVRLSENMGPENTLKRPAIDRTIEAIASFKKKFENLPNLNIKAICTAATRNATNQAEFLEEVFEKTGIQLEVITGQQEAHYDYLGVINSLPIVNGIIMDTGGASTELVLIQNGEEINAISIPQGAVTLTEAQLDTDVPSASQLFQLFDHLNTIYNDIWWLNRGTNLPLIALGGSNRTLAKIKRRNDDTIKDWEDIHGFHMSIQEVKSIFINMLSSNLDERKNISGLSKERADIIIGGLAPAMTLMRRLNSDRMIFSKRGVRFGILHERLANIRKANHAEDDAEKNGPRFN